MYILVFNYAKLLNIAIETGRVVIYFYYMILLVLISTIYFWILVCS